MSATLRYDMGVQLKAAIDGYDPRLIHQLGAYEASRWGGARADRWECWTFALKLPTQVELAYRTAKTLMHLARSTRIPLIEKRGAGHLAGKISRSLGVEVWVLQGFPGTLKRGQIPVAESAFLEAIAAEPGELAHWSAYADYLQDQGDRRGLLIAGWLGKRAIKVRYGVPVLAQ